MKSRIARLGVLVVSVMALVAGFAPSAEANNVGVLLVSGTAQVGQGLGYPCVGAATPDLTKCPVVGAGNTVGVTFGGTAVGAVVKVGKAKCGAAACVEVGTANVAAPTGTVSGWCGLSSGTLQGTVTPVVALGTKSNTRNFTVTFTGVGGLLVLTGTTAPQGETLVGVTVAVPDTPNGSSCLNKNAKAFVVVGALAVVR